jgi:hypothetical protein
VRFVDGSSEPIDLIVYATGFHISFPFIDRQLLNWNDGKPQLFLNAFHPNYDNLFVAGMIQPDSGIWGLVHYQARLMARFIQESRANSAKAVWFRRLKSDASIDLGSGIRYVPTPRHLLEVEHFTYRRRLKKLISQFGS